MYASFNSGELTPLLWDRVKFERYAPGAMLLDNFIVTKHGPIFHRPGSLFVNYATRNNALDFNQDKKRLKKFVFNRTQVFMLEFGHKYIKFYSYDAAGDPITVQKDGADYIVETPYRAEDLPELRFTQSMDTIYIAHSLYHPRVLIRHAANDWEFGNFNKQDGPYETENTDKDKTFLLSGKSGTVNLTANFDCFTGDMVGRLVRYTLSKKPVWGVITEVYTSRIVQIELQNKIPDDVELKETSSWRLGAWYGATLGDSLSTYSFEKTLSGQKIGLVTDSVYSKELRLIKLEDTANISTYDFGNVGDVVILEQVKEEEGKDPITYTASLRITKRFTEYEGTDLAPEIYCTCEILENTFPAGTTKFKSIVCKIDPIEKDLKIRVATTRESIESDMHYPAAVAFHMERLYFGGGLYTPQTVQGSRPGDFPVFSPTDDEDLVTDDMAVMFSLATDELNSIVWLKSTDSLYIGTIGPEFKLTVGGSEVITPSNFQFQRISNYGSSRVEPQFIGNSIIFSQNSLRTLRELTYNFSTDKYVAQDISVLGEHLTAPGLNSFNFQQEPHSIIWATQQVRENQLADTIERAGGRLIGLTYDKEQNVMAWHRHTIGGTEVEIESVECVFNDTIQQDQVWFCCRRKLNGQYVRTVEVIDKDFRMESPLEEMYFVDCGIKYNAYKLPKDHEDYGLGVKHLKGVNWLAGEKVRITVDGAMHPDKIVNEDGTLDLEYEGKFITVGLYAPAKYQSLYLDPEAGGTNFAQGHMQNIPKALIRFYRTMGGKFGPTFDKMEPIEYRTPQDAMDTAVPLFTGEKTVHFPSEWAHNSQVCVVQDEPLPMTILAILPEIKVVR